ncbi:glycosyltransferase [Haloarcula montana]|uniref:glycosyltransferase n=1 Tax=Haloarcula montana TaxID=3111776 RepID=UPI002D778ABA|nr:glycosyltransferase [Haloarcula sp. GH36]
MKIGYFCYRLSGTGPRTRAADIINGVANRSECDVVVLTNEPAVVSADAEVTQIDIRNPIETFLKARRAFSDVDIVHVPINIYQVLFVRLAYLGPLVAGVGPGIQNSLFHRVLGRFLGISVKIQKQEDERQWEQLGYTTASVTATIDRSHFYQYEPERIDQLRSERGIDSEQTVVLYVGELTEGQGAAIIDEMARITQDDDSIQYIVAGAGPLEERFRDRSDLIFEGFVDNKSMPQLYNIADVTAATRKYDVTSNVGLESIACGTPVITTASGKIEKIFKNRGTYVWADRDSQSVLETVDELMSDPEYYQSQVNRGFQTMEEMDLTLESAIETHLDVYRRLGARDRSTGQPR